MDIVHVPALRSFEYEGREVRPGAVVAMKAIDAATHARLGHVSLLQGNDLKADEPDEPVVVPVYLPGSNLNDPHTVPAMGLGAPKRRRTYRRKDLQADQTKG